METVDVLKALGITAETIINAAVDRIGDEHGVEILSAMKEAVASAVAKAAPAIIESKLSEAVESVLSTDYQPVDEWGEPTVGKKTNLRDMVKKRSLDYLAEKVDREGKTTNYNSIGTRGEWMARTAAEKAIDYSAKNEIGKAVEEAKAHVKRLVAKHITDTVLK